MRLIDADALRDWIGEDDCIAINLPGEATVAIIGIRKLIDKQPTVDAVPVVRCKDCKYYLTEDVECPCNIGLADATPDAQYTWTPEPTWFCADGERRESE